MTYEEMLNTKAELDARLYDISKRKADLLEEQISVLKQIIALLDNYADQIRQEMGDSNAPLQAP